MATASFLVPFGPSQKGRPLAMALRACTRDVAVPLFIYTCSAVRHAAAVLTMHLALLLHHTLPHLALHAVSRNTRFLDNPGRYGHVTVTAVSQDSEGYCARAGVAKW